MKILVKTNTKEVSRWLQRAFKDQLPYATSIALNDTAFQVRKELVDHTYKKAFNMKNPRFASFVTNVKKAKKNDLTASVGNLKSKVFDYLVLHSEGGIKKPRGRHLAIPSRDLKEKYPGKIPKSQRPKNIMKKKGGFTFKTKKQGIPIIAYRKVKRGKKGKSGDIEIKYILVEMGKIDKELMFYEDAKKVIDKNYTKNFIQAFTRAIRSAK